MPAQTHPNRRPFKGILTYLDKPSERAPTGARGRRVIMTRDAAHSALDSLLGMAVDFCPGWDGHDARRKCGIIQTAKIVEDRLEVGGYLFARDFPEVERYVEREPDGVLGMSYELADAHITDMRRAVWEIYKMTFTGAAILRADKAAYSGTQFQLV